MRVGDFDLLLQIDPSAFDLSAGYISRLLTSHHKLPHRSNITGGTSRLRPRFQLTPLLRHHHATTTRARSPEDSPH